MYKNESIAIFAFNFYKYILKVTHSLKMLKCKLTQCHKYLLSNNLIKILEFIKKSILKFR